MITNIQIAYLFEPIYFTLQPEETTDKVIVCVPNNIMLNNKHYLHDMLKKEIPHIEGLTINPKANTIEWYQGSGINAETVIEAIKGKSIL